MAINKQNLVVPTHEQAVINGRMGGIKSQKVQKKRKLMMEDAQAFLAMPLDPGRINDIKYLNDVRGKNITVQQAILLAMIKKALKGDRGAAEYVRDTAGQQVTNNIQVSAKTSDKFDDIVAQLLSGKGADNV